VVLSEPGAQNKRLNNQRAIVYYMKKKSLQRIEDFYTSLGYKGSRLRKILLKDKDYLKLLKERKQKLTKKISVTKAEKKKYVLSTDGDYEILGEVKQLENMKLTKEEKFLVKFIKTQLEHNWRKPLIRMAHANESWIKF